MICSKEKVLLNLMLAGQGEYYGLELVRSSNGKLGRGAIYVMLFRMEEKGLITSRLEDKAPSIPGVHRRLYKITETGKRELFLGEASASTAQSVDALKQ